MTKALIIAGYGLNCEEETSYAFEYNGSETKIIHINDLIDNSNVLNEYQIVAIPGGFSYGDDTGSGNAFAQKMRLSLQEKLHRFLERDTLVIGICNGCQILVNLGLVPAFNNNYGQRDIAVTYNKSNHYQCRWVDLKTNTESNSPWLRNIESLHIPVAHGEGRFIMSNEVLQTLKNNNQIATQYVTPQNEAANGKFPHNPNGSIEDIAGITDQNGKVLALMPHPERGMFTWQRNDYDYLKDQAQRTGQKMNETSDGMALFQNAVNHFSSKQIKRVA